MRPKPWPRARAGDDVGDFPGRQLVFPEIPQGEENAESQSPLKDAARTGDPEKLLRMGGIIRKITEKEDELRSDQGNDHDIEGGVDQPVGVETAAAGLPVKQS